MIWLLKIKKLIIKNKQRIIGASGGVVAFGLVVWSGLFFAVPGNYDPPLPIDSNEISLYLTNKLGPQLHNKAQYEQPFDLVVEENGVNDIIARELHSWQFDGLTIQRIGVAFEQGGVCLMGRCGYMGLDFIATVFIKPEIDKNGNFFLGIKKVKAGRARLPFAAMIIRKKIAGRLEKSASEKLFGDVADLLLNSGTIEPVMKVGGVKIRAEKIVTVEKKMIISFVPQE